MFKWITLFIIFVAAVKYFGIDVRGIVESPIVQDTLNFIINILAVIWNYIKEPTLEIINSIRNLI